MRPLHERINALLFERTAISRKPEETIRQDLDLLFYHRRLRRLVAIELKLGEFEAAHKGQRSAATIGVRDEEWQAS